MKRPIFEFRNHVSPMNIDRLFVRLEDDYWYELEELKTILRNSDAKIRGDDIVERNVVVWDLTGLARTQIKKVNSSRKKYMQLTALGRELLNTYSTNRELFYDLMHYVFYSAWHRSYDMAHVQFWLYARVCEVLWEEAPSQMDSFKLTNRLHAEAQQQFPTFNPAFPERSVGAVFPWLGALMPPFLEKCGSRSQLCSSRRGYCTPQLFHLACDLVFAREQLDYGTSMSIHDNYINEICKVCLLDPQKFWDMAGLTEMVIREFSLQRSQWGRSIVLAKPPTWIDLPEFSIKGEGSDRDDDEEVDDEKQDDEDTSWT